MSQQPIKPSVYIETTIVSYLTAWPTGQPMQTTSNLNFVAGQSVPNLAVIPLGSGGKVSIFNFDAITKQTTSVRSNLIGNAISSDVWAAFGLFNRFQIAISWPMTLYQSGQSFDDDNPPPDGTHVKAPSALDTRRVTSAVSPGANARSEISRMRGW